MPVIFCRHIYVTKDDAGRIRLRFWNKSREVIGATGKTMELDEAVPNGRKEPMIETIVLYEHLFTDIRKSDIKRSTQFAGWEYKIGASTLTLFMRDFEKPLAEKDIVAILGK